MTLKFTILGCGSSAGVPRPALGWGACDPNNPKNRRRRTSFLVERNGANGVTRVLIESDDGTGESWSTVGVDENIIAASWHALEEAVTYCLLRSGREPS